MATKLLLKKSGIAEAIPGVNDLDYGEVAINYADGKLYYKSAENEISSFANQEIINSEITQVISSTEVDNVLYVSKTGLDINNGKSLGQSFLTIKAAMSAATPGTTVFVKSGEYFEDNPVTIPQNVSLVGDNLRTTTIKPLNTTDDIFYVNNASYITGVTFKDHISPSSAIAFDPNGSAGAIVTSPYVQNCSSITTTGTGMRVDGSFVSGLRSMVCDAYTQINQGGIGIHIKNRGYAQLVSIFTVCTDIAILCESGGQCSLTNSNSSFGTFGLKSTGTSEALFAGETNGANQTGNTIVIDGLSTRPAVNDVFQFSGDSNYYTITSATELAGGQSIVVFDEDIETVFPDNTIVTCYQKSFISASGHTFEYVGTGNDLSTALPQAGGVPVQENEIVEDGGGVVFYTSTDHRGDFRIGGELTINRQSGTIEGRTFDRSLFAVLTPYILALEG
jgi:hypothetical protein